MKSIDLTELERRSGKRLLAGESFSFRCHAGLDCFNRCCRNLNLFLYPYDVIRLASCLGMTSDAFLEHHVDVVLRDGNHFPDVLLKMADTEERTCPFLTDAGCSVYPDRPDTCRTFPVEQGCLFDAETGKEATVSFFRPPDFCLGRKESRQWTLQTWARDQEAQTYNQMTLAWARLRRLFESGDPWQGEGPDGRRAKMAFMATYNMDQFREFVFGSSFLTRFRVKPALVKKMKKNDVELMKLGFDWIRFFLWGMKSARFRPVS